MCDYCKGLWDSSLTPAERLEKRVEKFVDELRQHPQSRYYNWNIADTLQSIIDCEETFNEKVEEAWKDMKEILTDKDVEEAIMHEQLDRDAK